MIQSAASIAAGVIPLWQQRHQHDSIKEQANALHREAIELEQRCHREALEQNEDLFLRDCTLERELHYGQLSHDFDIGRREGIRDAWSQRNLLLQTLMVIDTLTFAAAYSLLVQGDPPENTPVWVLRVYALSLGLCMSLLFSSVWCCLKLQSRLAHYDMHRQNVVYICGKQHRQFSDYYTCHCKVLSTTAFACFYVGAGMTLIAAALYAFTKFYYQFSNTAAGVIILSFAAIAAAVPYASSLLDSSWAQNVNAAGRSWHGEGAGDAGGGEFGEAALHEAVLSPPAPPSDPTDRGHEGATDESDGGNEGTSASSSPAEATERGQ